MNGSQLASVNDVFNAILVRGNATGDVVFYGKGAGKLPTASAVVADVIDCARNADKRKPFGWGDSVENYVADYDTDVNPLYIRAKRITLKMQEKPLKMQSETFKFLHLTVQSKMK